jgi:hypothetical protein
MVYGMGPYAGVDYNSPYLIVNSIVSYPPPNTTEKRETGLICKHKYEEVERRGKS